MSRKKLESQNIQDGENFDPLEVQREFRKEDKAYRWVRKDQSGMKFRQAQNQGWKPVEGHPEHFDLTLHELPREVAEKRKNNYQQEADERISKIMDNYDAQVVKAGSPKVPKRILVTRDNPAFSQGDVALQKDRKNARKEFCMGG